MTTAVPRDTSAEGTPAGDATPGGTRPEDATTGPAASGVGAAPAVPGRPVVVLVGPPGAGKTTVGTRVAAALGVPFVDTDDLVEAEAGQPIADVFVDAGEAHFRRLEVAAVAAALADPAAGVVALGGGAVLDPSTRARLAGHRVVLLDVGLPDAAARVGLNRDRPLLLGNPRGQLRRLLEERRPVYAEVAVATVPTDGRTPDEVAADVLDLVREPAP